MQIFPSPDQVTAFKGDCSAPGSIGAKGCGVFSPVLQAVLAGQGSEVDAAPS